MNILAELRQRFVKPLHDLVEDPREFLEMIRPAQNAQFGDYQANFAMSLGKKLGRPPREIALQVQANTQLEDLCQKVEVAGPGFINLTLRDDVLVTWLMQERLSSSARASMSERPRRWAFR